MNSQQPSKDEAGSLRRPSSAADSERRRFWERPSSVCEDTPEVNRKGRVRHMTIIISKTKLALGVLAMVLIGATVVAAGDNDNPFTDVPDVGSEGEAFYSAPVEWLWDNGLTTGSPAGSETFKPLDTLTRGEYATFNYRYDQNIVQPELETIDDNFDVVTDAINDNADAISDIEDNVATVASDVANAPRVYFARVDSDGTVEKGNGITVEKGLDGAYDVTLPENAANCAVETSLYASTTDGASQFVLNLAYSAQAWVWATHAESGDADSVDVFTRYMAGDTVTAFDLPFVVTAYCSDPLIVIVPGFDLTPIWELLG